MSISTKRGDSGQTSLAGGRRVSKGNLRVEGYGVIDELISSIGFARSICKDAEIGELVKGIQRELFLVSSAIATSPDKEVPEVTAGMVDALTDHVHSFEKVEGILSDWSIPGEDPASAAFDVARTVCRRAERNVVGLTEAGEKIQPTVLSYLNRLSDLLWIIGRSIELKSGVNASLRGKDGAGKRWSRAW
ncbi:cob(I)yrinic acid a,c-diamide adenosyltransferase [bacterium]|nr:cob(I)yrinic acid a,c-diamide adenosyltransferase [bacterium]